MNPKEDRQYIPDYESYEAQVESHIIISNAMRRLSVDFIEEILNKSRNTRREPDNRRRKRKGYEITLPYGGRRVQVMSPVEVIDIRSQNRRRGPRY